MAADPPLPSTSRSRPFPQRDATARKEDDQVSGPFLQRLVTRLQSRQTRRIISLAGSILVALSAGSNYAFSTFSPQLQESLKLTSTQINIVGVLGNMGVYLSGVLWGRWVDKQGPKGALLMGAILVAIGYGGQSLVYTHSYNHHSALAPAILNLLSGVGNSGAFTAAMNAQAKSFSGPQRGSATAIVLAGYGLSAFMYSTLSHELFPGNTSDFLLLLAFGSAASFLAGIALIRILPSVVTTPSSANDVESRSAPVFYRSRTSSDLSARAYMSEDDNLEGEIQEEEEQEHEHGHRGDERATLLGGADSSGDANASSAPSANAPVDVTGRKLLRRPDFQLLFLIMCLISGSGLLLINNVGTITRTLYEYNHPLPGKPHHGHGPKDTLDTLTNLAVEILKADENAAIQQEQAHQVSAISLGNASGRVAVGFLSDLWVSYLGSTHQRVWLLLPVTLLAFSSQFLFTLPSTINSVNSLLYGSTLTGFMYGGFHGIAPCLTFEWFGLKNAARNWSLVALAPVISGNVFNILFGKVYDSNVDQGATIHKCTRGQDCYRSAFYVTSFATALSVVAALVLVVRRGGLQKSIS
ncbi:unnamed protein product [Sympodiomycopsis kandeliae]